MDLLRHDTLSEEEQQNIGVRRFCACSMLVQAAVGGMGVAMGRTSMIAQEPNRKSWWKPTIQRRTDKRER